MAKYPRISSRFRRRISESKIKSKLLLFASILAVVFVILSFSWGEFGFIRIWILSQRIERLKKEIVVLKVEGHDIRWEMDKLKNDAEFIKRYAVEKYGYALPDNRVIQFVPADSASNQKDAATANGPSR